MAIHSIVICGNPILVTPSTPVENFDDNLTQLIEDLFETNTAAHGAGLAANQIGDDRAVFVYDLRDEQGIRQRGYFINPVITTSEIPETMPDPDEFEGCLSLPGEQFPTGRAMTAEVQGVNLNNEPISASASGYLARCFQHETDHLQGMLYVQRLTGRHKREAKRTLKKREWNTPDKFWTPQVDKDPFGWDN